MLLLKSLELSGFKSFAKKTELAFGAPISAIVGPNGSGKSNIAEAFRFVLGEQSIKSLRGKRGEDLIFNGSKSSPRSNRAGVKVVFDNSKKLFNVDFDEVAIERTVHRDGINDYSINGSRVRLRDVMELLSAANVGATGHHIISQGETDRILLASLRERREMIEDALGLKIFHYKKEESEKRLLKTKENIAHVEALRKEIAPHLAFLKKQAEKVERATTMRGELAKLYLEYLKRESTYLTYQTERLKQGKAGPSEKLAVLEQKLSKAKEAVERASETDARGKESLKIEEDLSKVRKEKEQLTRELGRLEGQIAFAEKREKENQSKAALMVSLAEVERVVKEVEEAAVKSKETENPHTLRNILSQITLTLQNFLQEHLFNSPKSGEEDTRALKAEKRGLEEKFAVIERREDDLTKAYQFLKQKIDEAKDESRAAEREMFRIMGEQGELKGQLESFRTEENTLRIEEENFKRELGEAGALIGKEVLAYEHHKIEAVKEDIVSEKRNVQDERRRKIEKIKIRLEELGGSSGEEVLKEYKEVSEREAFLSREVADLEQSALSLKELIAELAEKLNVQFKEGIEKINTEFSRFFQLMFGGGLASLTVIKAPPKRRKRTELDDLEAELPSDLPNEVEEEEEGIDIEISLPHKRIRGLQMLSGGERALTSIALLFAMSQVNPPPFIILDETDAALDEANSKRYGDMIEALSKKSQLIWITHNRETMGRASILYGVTMGSDGISKLLSVKFEEAVAVAK